MSDMKAVDILKAARELISDPAHWTQGAFARDAKGRSASVFGAKCFCIIGAISKVARTNLGSPVPHSVLQAMGVGSHARLAIFNDEHTHVEVLALLDKAIASAEVAQ